MTWPRPRFWLMFGETLAGFLGVGLHGFAEGILGILEGGHSVASKKKNGGMKQQECC